jgi:hypothetical protein
MTLTPQRLPQLICITVCTPPLHLTLFPTDSPTFHSNGRSPPQTRAQKPRALHRLQRQRRAGLGRGHGLRKARKTQQSDRERVQGGVEEVVSCESRAALGAWRVWEVPGLTSAG